MCVVVSRIVRKFRSDAQKLPDGMAAGEAEKAPLLEMTALPPAPFTSASFGTRSRRRGLERLPQAIAHRGYKALYPENTMDAFRAAVAVGAHAIETDLHMSRDKVVVLSHDGALKRCFGEKTKINECDWDYLWTLRTLREPHCPMPRLADLLEYLTQPGLEDIWVLLDIKRDDDPAELLVRVAETFASSPASRPWNQRVVLGCWNANYVKLCMQHMPGFAVTHIGWSVMYARQLLKVPNVSFNMLQKALVGPSGSRFIKAVRAAGRPLFVWTVNEEEWMEWSIRKDMDGVITDDPKLFLEVCDRWTGAGTGTGQGSTAKSVRTSPMRWAKLYAEAAFVQVLISIFAMIFLARFGSPSKQVRKAMHA